MQLTSRPLRQTLAFKVIVSGLRQVYPTLKLQQLQANQTPQLPPLTKLQLIRPWDKEASRRRS